MTEEHIFEVEEEYQYKIIYDTLVGQVCLKSEATGWTHISWHSWPNFIIELKQRSHLNGPVYRYIKKLYPEHFI